MTEQPFGPLKLPPNRRGRRVARIGLTVVVVAIPFLFSPLLLGKGKIGVATAAFAFIVICLGLSITLHGAWDWWRGR